MNKSDIRSTELQRQEQLNALHFEYFRIQEVAYLLKVSRSTVKRFVGSGILTSVRVTQRITLIPKYEVQGMIARQQTKGGCVDAVFGTPLMKPKEQATPRPVAHQRGRKGFVPAEERAPEGVTHETHYTLTEVCDKFGIKYGTLYSIRKRYAVPSVRAWATSCFPKREMDAAVRKYIEEQGMDLSADWYSTFDIMKLYGIGETQVRRFAEYNHIRVKVVQNGHMRYYLKADWDSARKASEKRSWNTKKKR